MMFSAGNPPSDLSSYKISALCMRSPRKTNSINMKDSLSNPFVMGLLTPAQAKPGFWSCLTGEVFLQRSGV